MSRSASSAVELGLFTHRFAALAREMGESLRRTAISTNVKERLDFSCGLLDPRGRLVVNAPHIPVHLGALGLCVRRVAEALSLGPGDVAVTNHPAFGGSHLPDVTVITPVFDAAGRRLGYVANRAHHAEIGGTRPGSMPPDARTLAEEGVVIPPTLLVAGGESRFDELRKLLTSGPWPSRSPEENLADLEAAVAANHRGARGLARLAADHGTETVLGYMGELATLAAQRVEEALSRLGAGTYRGHQRLDDGTDLQVTIRIEPPEASPRATLDFEGTGPVHPGNLNAPPAVARSAVLYVLRLLLVGQDEEDDLGRGLPLNEGLLRPVDLRVPTGILNPVFEDLAPENCPAVVGGNVETSQRVVDTLLQALGLAACSQGTMNNLLFGNERFGYYETVCGGAGAGPGFDGCPAVHTHMTNTRITDPEILELRYPVRLDRFEIRRGSGGAGRHPGGDGTRRELTFLEPVSLSLLSQHRVEVPYGLHGGAPGDLGRQHLVHSDGTRTELDGISAVEVAPGERLVLDTPGGGGCGQGRRS